MRLSFVCLDLDLADYKGYTACMKNICKDCGKELTGHGAPSRCRSCAAREAYIQKHGKPPERVIANCDVCSLEFTDYASNRRKGEARTCSAQCRAAWTGIVNSIKRGGDGKAKTKKDKDARYYRNPVTSAVIRQRVRDRYKEQRQIILKAYGSACVCCGEKHPEFITIDHINGDGHIHRKTFGGNIYAYLIKHKFPKDNFRLLCFNCNNARAFYGFCPHMPDDYQSHSVGRPRIVA